MDEISHCRLSGCLGTLVTTFSSGSGAFARQFLEIESLSIDDPVPQLAPGNIPRSEAFANYSGNYAWGTATAALTVSSGLKLALGIKAAVFNGIFTDNIVPLAPNFPAGNCSWPRTTSLAICGDALSPTTYLSV